MKCIIAGGGDRCTVPANEGIYIAADSGRLLLEECGIVPDIIIGDFDSSERPTDFGGEIITVPCEKDDTDTMLAVKKGFELGCTEFDIYGCTGGRLSHTLANIQTLEYIHLHGGHGRLISDGCTVSMIFSGETERFAGRGYLSVFAAEPSETVIDGAQYSGRFTLDRNFPLGVSNHIDGTAEISVITGVIISVIEQ